MNISKLKLIILPFLLLREASAACPLDLQSMNYTEVISACYSGGEGLCCRHVNAMVGITVAKYANLTGQLGVPEDSAESCVGAISNTFEDNGLRSNPASLCGLGSKIPVKFRCGNLETVEGMEQNSNFKEVSQSCIALSSSSSFSSEDCRRCLSASTAFIRQLVGVNDHLALSTCRDAIFATIASHGEWNFTVQMAKCFFGLGELGTKRAFAPSIPQGREQMFSPVSSPAPSFFITMAPSRKTHIKKTYSLYHLTLVPSIGIGIMGAALTLFAYVLILICRKRQELSDYGKNTRFIWCKPFSEQPVWKLKRWRKGSSHTFQRFTYRQIQKATNDFQTIVGKGGFGTVYKAEFDSGLLAAVKRMDKISQQGESEFSKEMELLGRLHHRHLVTLSGFCAEKQERFLVYEYMQNGSLKDHLHTSMKPCLDWKTRIQIAVDVATALEYLHFFCDPPLCHRDIKSSNILLDENFVAKVADFGLAHSAPSGADKFEPINTDIRGTPGYMDPEYVTTQELTQKSDIYSYGVLLLELITARRAVHENKNLVEWAQQYILAPSRLQEIVDPMLAGDYNKEELQNLVNIAKLCVQPESKTRPSMKQVLRSLYEKLDTASHDLMLSSSKKNREMGIDRREEQGSKSANRIDLSGDLRCLQSSPSTSRSYCSRSFLLETGSPGSSPMASHTFV